MITARECIAVHARHRELLGAITHLERFEAAPPDVWAARGVVRFEGAANEPSGGSGADTEETEWSGDLAEVQRRLAVVRTMEAAFRKRWKLDATPAARAPPWRRALCACCATETPEERLEVSAPCRRAVVYGSLAPELPFALESPLGVTVARLVGSGSCARRCGVMCGRRSRGTRNFARSTATCRR